MEARPTVEAPASGRGPIEKATVSRHYKRKVNPSRAMNAPYVRRRTHAREQRRQIAKHS
ncbi:hypothetical protein H6P81_007283 [Aristolochia fimbriata]|uniref:Uncharacterized protein n=1 Tax=Aristolochia fimbriata TaxID=158543 RepID=A0AAV7F0F4_ARIFI|nr:hypothetical protein H6P81_007283 [Aristolochia fimbriata]